MKLVQSLIVAVAMVAPVAAFAQSSQPLTRAQVQAELAQLEQAGYNPASNDLNYPQDIQAAEAKVQAQNAASGYGGVANGSSASGSVSSGAFAQSQDDTPGLGPIFAHP